MDCFNSCSNGLATDRYKSENKVIQYHSRHSYEYVERAVKLTVFDSIFFRISWLNWISHVNRMDSKRKEGQVSSGKSTKRTTKKQMVELCTNRY